MPLSTSTISLKVKTMSAFLEILVALSVGVDEFKVGSSVSVAVKLKFIPAEELLEASINAAESINIVYSVFGSKSDVGFIVI